MISNSFFSRYFLWVVLFFWILIPSMAYSQISRILALLSFVLLVILNLNRLKLSGLVLSFLFISYTFIINTVFSNSSFLFRHIQLYIFITLIPLSSIILQFDRRRKIQVLTIIITLNLIALFGTFLGLIEDSSVARVLAKSSEESVNLAEQGVGGYGIIYFNVVLIPLVIYFLSKINQGKILKSLHIVTLVMQILVIIKSGYLIAILVMTLELLVLGIYFSKIFMRISIVTILLLGFIFLKSNISFVEKSTYSLVEGTSLSLKHSDIFNLYKGRPTENNTIEARKERYLRSIEIFENKPFIGELSFDKIGKHSNILDISAQFGFVFLLIFLIIILRVPKSILVITPAECKPYIVVFILGILVVGLFNNYALQHGVSYCYLSSLYGLSNRKTLV